MTFRGKGSRDFLHMKDCILHTKPLKPFTLAGTFVAGGAEGQEDDISFTIKDTGNDVEFF